MIKNSASCETLETASSKDIKTKSEAAEENSSNGTENFGSVEKKAMLESDSSEKREELFRDPNVRKLCGKSSGTPRNIGTDSDSSIQSSKKNSSRKGKKSSDNHHDEMSFNKSETPDSSGSIIREKSPKTVMEALDDIPEVVPNAYINSHSESERSESAGMIEGQVRKASHEATMDEVENEDERLEILSALPCQMKEKQEAVNVSCSFT